MFLSFFFSFSSWFGDPVADSRNRVLVSWISSISYQDAVEWNWRGVGLFSGRSSIHVPVLQSHSPAGLPISLPGHIYISGKSLEWEALLLFPGTRHSASLSLKWLWQLTLNFSLTWFLNVLQWLAEWFPSVLESSLFHRCSTRVHDTCRSLSALLKNMVTVFRRIITVAVSKCSKYSQNFRLLHPEILRLTQLVRWNPSRRKHCMLYDLNSAITARVYVWF
jgi:hypothetical protein